MPLLDQPRRDLLEQLRRPRPLLQLEQQFHRFVEQAVSRQRFGRRPPRLAISRRVLFPKLLHEQRPQQLMASIHRRVVGVLRDKQHPRRCIFQQPFAVAPPGHVVAERRRPDRQQRDLPQEPAQLSRHGVQRLTVHVLRERQPDVRPGHAARPADRRFSLDLRAPARRSAVRPRPEDQRRRPALRALEQRFCLVLRNGAPHRAEQFADLPSREREVGRPDRRHVAPRDQPRQRRDRRPRPRSHDDVHVFRCPLEQEAQRRHHIFRRL